MKRTNLEVVAIIVILLSGAVLAGKAVESAVVDHKQADREVAEAKATFRGIRQTMDECSRTAQDCCDGFNGCVDDLARCRDALVMCEEVMRDVARLADIHLPLPDGGTP